RAITCVSNQKEIGLAVMMYVQDYDETYPVSEYGGGGANCGPQQSWASLVWPYVKNGDRYTDANGIQYSWGTTGIYSCPSAPDQTKSFKYGIHMDLCPSNWNCGTKKASPLSLVDAPADKVLIVEKGRNDTTWGYPYYDTWEWDWVSHGVGNPR